MLEKKIAWKIAGDIADLKEGQIVTYAIEVADNHSGDEGPFVARSQARKLYIVSVREYLDYVLEKRKKLLGDIKIMHGQEQEASEQVDDLKKEVSPQPE